jgi:hypothetical protein
MPSDPCDANFTAFTHPGGPVTLENHCSFVQMFKEPDNGCSEVAGTSYADSYCVEIHEDGHLEEFRQALENEANDMVIEPVPVSGNPRAPSCATALADHADVIRGAVNEAFSNAIELWPDHETYAEGVAWQCNCLVADGICQWALSQGHDECEACPAWCD